MTESLKDWLVQANFQEDLAPLAVLLQILLFELNRPLEPWYGHLPEFPSEEFSKAIDRLPAACSALKRRLIEYQRDCEAETGQSFDRWTKSRRANTNVGGES